MKCPFLPDQQGYGIDFGETNIWTELSGGKARIRSDILNPASRVKVTWTLNREGYHKLQEFKRAYDRRGGEPFEFEALADTYRLLMYKAIIVPNTWKLASTQGYKYVVTCELQLKHKDFDSGYITAVNDGSNGITGNVFWQEQPYGGSSLVYGYLEEDPSNILSTKLNKDGSFDFGEIEGTGNFIIYVDIDNGFDKFRIQTKVMLLLTGVEVVAKYGGIRLNNLCNLTGVDLSSPELIRKNLKVKIDGKAIQYDINNVINAGSGGKPYAVNIRLPNDLYDTNSHVITFSGKYCAAMFFYTTTGLNGNALAISEVNYFIVKDFSLGSQLFRSQTSLTTVHNQFETPNMTDAWYMFEGCSNLVSVPSNLFELCPKIYRADSVFERCSKLTTGVNFNKCPLLQSAPKAYYYCINMTSIPSGSFRNCSLLTDITSICERCTKLQNIGTGMFYGCESLTTMNSAFAYATALQGVDSSMFGKCNKITSANGAFRETGITVVPDSLFRNNPDLYNIGYIFYGCKSLLTVGDYVFGGATKLFIATMAFSGCSSLTQVGYNIFSGCASMDSASNCFSNCSKLINAPSFADCVALTQMYQTFMYCTSLVDINSLNIKNITTLKSLDSTFLGCSSLATLPENLISGMTNLELMPNTFQSCKSITSIPTNFLRYNTALTSMVRTFSGSGIAKLQSGLFINKPKLTRLESTFASCVDLLTIDPNALSGATELTILTGCFEGCSKLTVPNGTIFNALTKLVNVQSTFANCKSLTTVPSNLFDNNKSLIVITLLFSGSGLTVLPKGIFKNNTNIVSAVSVCLNCTDLVTVEPAFKHLANCNMFTTTFSGCSSLKTVQTPFFNANVRNTNNCFKDCTSLEINLDSFFEQASYTDVFDWKYMFLNNVKLTGSGMGLINKTGKTSAQYMNSLAAIFKGCTGLSDYNDLPAILK